MRLTRRDLAAGALGAAAAGVLPGAAKGGARHAPIGLQLYSVRDDCARDLPGVIRAVSAMGYTGVEFAGYYDRTAEELRRMLDANHLKCYGTHIALDTLLGEHLAKTVEFNRVMGNRMLIVPWIAPERRNSRQSILATAKLFGEIAAQLEPHGMYLGYHNHMDEFKPVDGEMPFYTFWNAADRHVFIQFDTGNAMEAGQQAAPYISKFPGRVWSVHVKDHSTTNRNALLGEGDVHWNEVLPLITGPAGTRYFIIEQETYPYPPLECADRNLHTFRKMLASDKAAA